VRYLFFDPHGETLILIVGTKGRTAEIAKRLNGAKARYRSFQSELGERLTR